MAQFYQVISNMQCEIEQKKIRSLLYIIKPQIQNEYLKSLG